MAETRRACREATREEYGKAIAKRWAEQHKGTIWEHKSGTIGTTAQQWARRTEDGWRHEATQMSDAEIFAILGIEEEEDATEQTTTETEATQMAETEIATTEETTEQTIETTKDTEMDETTETKTEMATEEQAREWAMLETDIDTATVANTILEWRDGYRCEQEEVPADIELWAIRNSDGYLTQAQKWEQDPSTADAWQKVWEHVRAGRIGGYTQDWIYTDDAWLLAAEFANEVLGIEDGEPTAEWEDLTSKCLEEMGRLL